MHANRVVGGSLVAASGTEARAGLLIDSFYCHAGCEIDFASIALTVKAYAVLNEPFLKTNRGGVVWPN